MPETKNRQKVALGVVGHFGLAVRYPERAAEFWQRNFDLAELFRFDDVIGLSNDAVTIVLHPGTPNPATFGHMSFHVADMATLRQAVEDLRANGVELEDPRRRDRAGGAGLAAPGALVPRPGRVPLGAFRAERGQRGTRLAPGRVLSPGPRRV